MAFGGVVRGWDGIGLLAACAGFSSHLQFRGRPLTRDGFQLARLFETVFATRSQAVEQVSRFPLFLGIRRWQPAQRVLLCSLFIGPPRTLCPAVPLVSRRFCPVGQLLSQPQGYVIPRGTGQSPGMRLRL